MKNYLILKDPVVGYYIGSSNGDDPSVEIVGEVEKEVFDAIKDCPDAYEITETGEFVQKMTAEQVKAKLLSQKYIPSSNDSLNAFLFDLFAANPPKDTQSKMRMSGLYSEWAPGNYSVGDIRNYAGQTWECWTDHDNAIYPDITPDNPQTWANFWRPLHGTSIETARPWSKPWAGTTDMYHAGEYMVYSDDKVYRCTSDTVYSPEEYAQAWEEVN